MNDNISLATLIATVLNLEVNIEILQTNKIRNEQELGTRALLKEIVELLKPGRQLPDIV